MYYHIESLSPLYEDVQRSGLFADSKFFVDCIPKLASESIVAQYNASKNAADFNLADFVDANFIYPKEHHSGYSSTNKSIDTHLQDLWEELTRNPDQQAGTLIPLPHQYIVPGGRFREIYYWDSYFTMLGLKHSGRIDLIENMVNNFAYLIDEFGFIPNGNRTYYLSRSQPPFFALMVSVLMDVKGATIVQEYLPQIEKEYQFWMDGADSLSPSNSSYRRVVRLNNGAVLNRYWDDKQTPRPEAFVEDEQIAAASASPAEEVYRNIRAAAESGWDFSSRWFADGSNMDTIQTTQIIPIDLNCLLYFTEVMISAAYFNRNDQQTGKAFLVKSTQRKNAIQQYCWDDEKKYFFDYQFIQQKQTTHLTLAGTFPLFFHLCTIEQAASIEKIINDEFLQPGGLITTTNHTHQQWDAPNGWAPLQWIAYKGLKSLDENNETAKKLKANWLQLNNQTFEETGKMMEKYNVANTSVLAGGGEYPNQDGFGWTNGVYIAMSKE